MATEAEDGCPVRLSGNRFHGRAVIEGVSITGIVFVPEGTGWKAVVGSMAKNADFRFTQCPYFAGSGDGKIVFGLDNGLGPDIREGCPHYN
jgi:hypothetical protein